LAAQRNVAAGMERPSRDKSRVAIGVSCHPDFCDFSLRSPNVLQHANRCNFGHNTQLLVATGLDPPANRSGLPLRPCVTTLRRAKTKIASVGVSPPNLFFFFVARMERSETRGANRNGRFLPDFVELVIGPATSGGTRWLHPGYFLRSGRSEQPSRHHHLSHFALRLRADVTVACHSSDAKSRERYHSPCLGEGVK
jgi:hypothetical protein